MRWDRHADSLSALHCTSRDAPSRFAGLAWCTSFTDIDHVQLRQFCQPDMTLTCRHVILGKWHEMWMSCLWHVLQLFCNYFEEWGNTLSNQINHAVGLCPWTRIGTCNQCNQHISGDLIVLLSNVHLLLLQDFQGMLDHVRPWPCLCYCHCLPTLPCHLAI